MSRSALARREAMPAQRMLLTLLMLSSMMLAVAALGGCNTIEGAGEDMSAAGRAVKNSAEETKQSM